MDYFRMREKRLWRANVKSEIVLPSSVVDSQQSEEVASGCNLRSTPKLLSGLLLSTVHRSSRWSHNCV